MNADIKVYREALDFVFDKANGLRNVAITGSYSAGKSSVIETYKREKYNHKFLHISLAHFEKWNVEKEGSKEENSIKDSELEGKIINQLIHQIPSDRIPQTQFKVKRRLRSSRLWVGTVVIATLVALFIFLLNNKKWDTYIGGLTTPWLKSILKYTTNDVFSFFALLTVIGIVAYFIYFVMRIQYNKNIFRKLTVQGNEIEIFSGQDESYFDKYLNEVLYLFENSGYQIFIFEDMDRFNDNKIFEKLREINTLLNKKSANVFWFVYLLRDDMFTSKDRTKFFDFIVPIVPVVDGSNSFDQFLDHFKKGGFLQHFEVNFLQGISLYIDDMRLLKNIYNEYVIYHGRIQSTELSADKLLAMITYKNLFPRDFNELQLNRGFVYQLFRSKESFIEKEVLVIENEIYIRQQKLNSSEEELNRNLDELDAIYLTLDRLGVDGKIETHFTLRRDFLKALKASPEKVYIHNTNGRHPYDFNHRYQQLLGNEEYISRKEAIENKTKEAAENLHHKIYTLQNQLRTVKDKKLKEIVNKSNIDEIFAITFMNDVGDEEQFIDVKSNPYFWLIKYLIRNGYIDETYPDYMTYFYENSLSRNDKIFLRSITDEIAKEFTYSLKNIALIVSRLKSSNFDQEEILNFDLLEYLLQKKHSYLQRFINQLKERSRLDFIQQFLSTEREKRFFIQELNRAWPLLWKEILNSPLYSEQEIKQYALSTLYYSTNKEVRAVNEEGFLTSYISRNDRFLDIEEPHLNLLIEKFDLLGVKFLNIDYERVHSQLFREVYENNLYGINLNMIVGILQNVYVEQNEDDLKHRNFTLITSRPEEGLTKYIRNNMSLYLNVLFESCNAKIMDSEEAALEILNHTEVPVTQKEEYLTFLETPLRDLDNVQETRLWSLLLQGTKLQYSMHNILRYYFVISNKMTDELTTFINCDASQLVLNFDDVSSGYGDQRAHVFYESIIVNENLIDTKYEMLLAGYGHNIDEFTFKGISNSKVDILIKHSIIEMNANNLQFMREHYLENVPCYILSNIEHYAYEVISEDNFDFTELLHLLQSEIEEKHKIHLLQYTDQPISLQRAEYSESVQQHIINNNLNGKDIEFLISGYEQRVPEFKQVIFEMCVTNMYTLTALASKNIIPFSLLILLLEADRLQKSDKIKLLILMLSHLSSKQVQRCFEILHMPDHVGLFDGKRPKLQRNEINEGILKVMKERGWISSFEIDQREDDYFRARGKKQN
ncbi:hypothetical protein RBB83_13305 [Paenibacillus peoriae]|uniref:YobI family P-loop NTPase n=1 Tax=Paenibacillus peoriae TaxID=59893 RepID=UPI0030D1677F